MKEKRNLIVLMLVALLINPTTNYGQSSPGGKALRIASLQAGTNHYVHGNPGLENNFGVFDSLARVAALQRPDLIVWPEYAITGWPYPSKEVFTNMAEEIPGNGYWYSKYVKLVRQIRVPVLCWMIEKDSGKYYNTAFILDENGHFKGKYRKVHVNLGEQTWWGLSQGQSLKPIRLHGVNYGISICADMFFPETVRCEELLGADVVVHMSISDDMEHLVPARSADSKLPIVMSIFRGGNYAVDGEGALLEKLTGEESSWHIYEVHPFRKYIINKYGGLWDVEKGSRNIRNVDAYKVLTDPSTRPAWTEFFMDEEGNPQTREDLVKRFHGIYDATDAEPYRVSLVRFDSVWTSPYHADPNLPYQFVNNQGRHLFVMNKTAWAYFGCDDPAMVLDKAAEQGVNVLRVALEGRPYFDYLGIELWPWGGSRSHPDWSSLNEPYWQEVERRIRMAGEKGIGLDLVLYSGFDPDSAEIPQQRFYWQMVLNRLSRYSNILTWEIENEYIRNEAFQDAAGMFFKKHDPYHRPVCTSTGTTDDAVWPHKSWMDLAIVHTCTGSTPKYPLDAWYQSIARNTRGYGKPAFNNETGREVRHKNDDPVSRRKQSWIWCASGAFWTYHSWEGCEGINDPDYIGPGHEFIRPLTDFFRSIDFWDLDPKYTVFQTESKKLIVSTLSSPQRKTTVSYLCTPKTDLKSGKVKMNVRLPSGDYSLQCIDPVNLSVLSEMNISSHGLGDVQEIRLDPFRDDLLILMKKITKNRHTVIKGTE